MCNSKIETARATLNNRFIGLQEDPAQQAAEIVYDAMTGGILPNTGPCSVETEKGIIVFSNSCIFPSDRGPIFLLGVTKDNSPQE